MAKEKLKVLCLHGCRQNGKIFREKTGFLRRQVKDVCEFTYVSAPHSISPLKEGLNDNYDYKTWWYSSPDKTYISKLPSDTDEGFSESLKFLAEFVHENGPFDGLLGFSQGAALAALILYLIKNKEFEHDLKFVVLISGFKSLCKPHLKYYDKTISIPSLHVFGHSDEIISKERSQELLCLFEKGECLEHNGGHHVPFSKDCKDPFKLFFDKMYAAIK